MEGFCALTQREKQALRLLLAGHDAKSMARHLGLSVHTVNERLRDARRKLAVSTSKEAARILRKAEGPTPENLGDEEIGGAKSVSPSQQSDELRAPFAAFPRNPWAIGGFAMFSFSVAMLALLGASEMTQSPARSGQMAVGSSFSAPETPVTQTARQWLALVDASDWNASWAATAQSFRSLNSVEAWQSASLKARVPRGRAVSRRLASEESIPAPPHGYQLVRFRTRFANGGEVIETLSLAREGATWKVAGYYIDQ